MRAVNPLHEFRATPRVGCNMSDCRGPRHEEDGISQVICYLLGAFTIGMSLALFIIVERL